MFSNAVTGLLLGGAVSEALHDATWIGAGIQTLQREEVQIPEALWTSPTLNHVVLRSWTSNPAL